MRHRWEGTFVPGVSILALTDAYAEWMERQGVRQTCPKYTNTARNLALIEKYRKKLKASLGKYTCPIRGNILVLTDAYAEWTKRQAVR